ncbi:MAG: phosphoglycerate dehydrogenase [Hyphomonadaceae bacterium]|nr:phosphoglycerate dehydrogenase [Clostridia bacterium]
MYEIKTLNKIAQIGVNMLGDHLSINDQCENPDGVLVRSADMHATELSANLKAIARAGAGVNNIPVERCSEKGIVVFNTPGANANAVKELTIAGLLLSARKIADGIIWAKTLNGTSTDVAKDVEKGKASFVGPELLGKTLGVIGLGAIGVMVANAVEALGMDVIGFDPYISVDAAWGLSRTVKKAMGINEILSKADYITLHVPLNKDTKGMINKESFGLMKQGVRIVNFSRGELVNDVDMRTALANGLVATYVTDFPNEEILQCENVVAIPHLGASTPESEDNCAIMAARELREYLENGNIVNSVNFPTCDLPRSSETRICIAHQNIPNMLSQISTAVAKHEINIQNMLNKSKGNMAYTILDIDGSCSDVMTNEFSSIAGVLKVRVLS